jgi:hypothetical protein
MIDPQTGCDDDYDESIKWAIEEIINEIHRIKELDALAVESIHYSLFNRELEDSYNTYLGDLQTDG